ncbi:MAG TPA: DNA-3-methyladenine glycosylase [Nitrososphaerales archaeon]|nr:DNA-3-methyladenine glycosylase [Nitrososphaerales archaeon]
MKRLGTCEENEIQFANPMSGRSLKMASVTLAKNESWGGPEELVPLPGSFYERNTITVARELTGELVVRRIGDAILIGRIVETEAYTGSTDPASHAFHGKTPRNAVMFSKGGLAYVYFVYGSSFCLNATCEREGKPGAVLIRALEPLRGIGEMCANRSLPYDSLPKVSNGPGKLTQALRITSGLNGIDLTQSGELMICRGEDGSQLKVASSPRIGIARARRRKWRFFVKGNPFVSRR